jgi:DNA-binding beta-propeller fold protein YncE
LLTRWQLGFVPDGIALDSSGNVFVTDLSTDAIHEYTSAGVAVRSWGSSGMGAGQFDTPTRLSCDAAGNVYVADYGNCRIQMFSPQGQVLCAWGTAGSAPGEFANEIGVTAGPDGDVYVADTNNSRVQVFGFATTPARYVSWGALKSARH